ncbi:MAG: zinc-ribbon domain-containing protein [Deltaproteobacteria bacterium]|nr:zinc-ribbon domain-containing protein [Deltaproteobacteria bacterium]MBN2672159.1 zinc-ribbon domain-containing protein [Deltaproteobacteria bacterium]
MKIICDNCGAKYSIADEKVRGKVFKIRCKKCQESIVVRGDAQEQPEAAEAAQPVDTGAGEGGDVETRVFDYSGYKGNDPVWYVAVDGGEQQGPYTTEQMKEYLQAGNIALESYVWREGLDDWKTVSDVSEISGVQAHGAAPAATAAGAAVAVAATTADAGESGGGLFDSAPAAGDGGGLFDSAPIAGESSGGGLFDSAPTSDDGGGLFGGGGDSASPGDVFSSAPADTSTGGLFSADQNAAAATKDGGGLFDGPDAAGTGGDLFASTDSGDDGGGIFASTEAQSDSPRVSAAAAMTGQRNENSVLFSLSNLQALASDRADAGGSAADSGGGVSGGAFGLPAGGSEASGLIDIRAMASSLADEAEKADDVDDMLSLGGGGFASTLGAPVLTAAKPTGMSMGAKIGIGAGALVAAVIAVVLIVMLAQKDKDTAAQDEKIKLLMQKIEEMQRGGANVEDIKKVQAELQKTKNQKKAIESGDVVAMNGQNAQEGDAQNEAADKADNTGGTKKKATGGSAAPAAKKSSSSDLLDDKTEESAAPPPKKKTNTSALDSLLGPTKTTAPKPKAASSEKLTRQQVISGMNAVRSAVNRCGAGKSGTFKIRAKIDPSGRVSSAQAVGDFAGTPAGTCAANAVSRARFPSSSAATNVTYPFKI